MSGTALGCFLGFNPYSDWGAYFSCPSPPDKSCSGRLEITQAFFWMAICNRIIFKVAEFFRSCTHVNSCQKYALYINLHILLMFLFKA